MRKQYISARIFGPSRLQAEVIDTWHALNALKGHLEKDEEAGTLAVMRALSNEVRSSTQGAFHTTSAAAGGASGSPVFTREGSIAGISCRAEKTFIEGHEFAPVSLEAVGAGGIAAFIARTNVKRAQVGLGRIVIERR